MGPITVVANVNYAFQDMFSAAEYYQKEFNVTSKINLILFYFLPTLCDHITYML